MGPFERLDWESWNSQCIGRCETINLREFESPPEGGTPKIKLEKLKLIM